MPRCTNDCKYYKDRKVTRNGKTYQVWRCRVCGHEWEEEL